MDRRDLIAQADETGAIADAQCDRLRPGRHEDVVLKLQRQFQIDVGRYQNAGRRRGVQLFVQPGHAEIGDRRNENQDFGDHHEEDRQKKDFRRQPAARFENPHLLLAWHTGRCHRAGLPARSSHPTRKS
jgi:hypothetical protein